MNNGDRITPPDSHAPFSNWREQELGELSPAESFRYIQAALVELDRNFRMWKATDDSRIKMAVELAADLTADRIYLKTLRVVNDLGIVVQRNREELDEMKGTATKAARDSKTALEEAAKAALTAKDAKETADDAADRTPVTMTHHLHLHPKKTDPPEDDGLPPSTPLVPKKWARKHKIMAWVAFFLTVAVTTAISVLAAKH